MRIIALFLAILCVAYAHTMLRCTKVASRADGNRPPTYTCDGFPRNYRSPNEFTAGFDRGYTYKILSPGAHALDFPACSRGPQNKPAFDTTNTDTVDQTTPRIRFSANYPLANARPGESLLLTWTPNGHKAGTGSGTTPYHTNWTIHWTGNTETQITTRGQLLSGDFQLGPEKFYDADCTSGPNNNPAGGQDSWPCYGSFTIPLGTRPGVYQFIWWWQFDKQSPTSVEEYTTCFDVNVYTGNAPSEPASPTVRTSAASQTRTSASQARTSDASQARTSAASQPRTASSAVTDSDASSNPVEASETSDNANFAITLSVSFLIQLVAFGFLKL